MAGGVFTSQNKVRPGAYINFKSVPKPVATIGTRGIVTMPVPMSWGKEDTLIEVYSTDITDGKCLEKIGYLGSSIEAQIFREALKNSYLLLLYRLDSGGDKASGVIGDLGTIAKYPGKVGNRISIQIKAVVGGRFEVITLVDTAIVDSQIVTSIDDLKSNSWVDFTGTGNLIESAGVTLADGLDGTINTENYSKYLEKIKTKYWNTMGAPMVTEEALKSQITQFVKQLREDKGKKVQVVLNDYASANYEGVISIDQGYKTAEETVPVTSFIAYVAGLTAGSAINQSNTYHVIDGAIEVINPKSDEEIENALLQGQLILSYRQDEKVIIERDINTLNDFGDKGKEFSKNRVIRALDDINNTIKLKFEMSYLGKEDNTEDGRNTFKADIIAYLSELQRLNAIKNFSAEDVIISLGQDIDSVIVDLGVQPVDAMEKLYMTVLVG